MSVLILSHKYKFIFIKTVKTAGTSIEVFLSQFCGEDDIVTPIWPYIEPHQARNYRGIRNPITDIVDSRGHGIRDILRKLKENKKYYNHISAMLVRNRISNEIWNSYYKFCVERNPWDKTLSHYHMVNKRASGNITLQKYIDEGAFCLNYPLYCDPKGNMIVDKVIKYESLISELSPIFFKLGIPFEGSLGVKAKSEYRQDKRPYQEVFTIEQKTTIEKAFAKEIEMHGYTY